MIDWRRQARRALREYPRARRNGDAQIVEAVETALRMQDVYPNAADRRRMVELVYWRQTHTMQGAAEVCHYTRETVQKWNIEILSAVYVGLLRAKREPGD